MAHRAAVAILPTIRRRRRGGQARMERTSLSLRADVLEAAKEVVQTGEAENLSAFVEQAIEEKLRRSKRQALYAAYQEAARDPEFMADMDEVTREFSVADSDGLRGDGAEPSAFPVQAAPAAGALR